MLPEGSEIVARERSGGTLQVDGGNGQECSMIRRCWADESVVIIAGGPSLTAADVEHAKGRARVIAACANLCSTADAHRRKRRSSRIRSRGGYMRRRAIVMDLERVKPSARLGQWPVRGNAARRNPYGMSVGADPRGRANNRPGSHQLK